MKKSLKQKQDQIKVTQDRVAAQKKAKDEKRKANTRAQYKNVGEACEKYDKILTGNCCDNCIVTDWVQYDLNTLCDKKATERQKEA